MTPELRSEAANAMALVDLRPVREWRNVAPRSLPTALDPTFERYACCDSSGNLSVRAVSDDREILTVVGKGRDLYFNPRFSADGKYLAAQVDYPPRKVQVWNLETTRPVLQQPLEPYADALDFHPDAPVVAVNDSAGIVHFVDLASGRNWSWSSDTQKPQSLCFGPAAALGSTHRRSDLREGALPEQSFFDGLVLELAMWQK